MARKQLSLAEAAGTPRPQPTQEPQAPAPVPIARASRGHSREGKKMVAGWYDAAAVKQLHLAAVQQDTTVQDLLGRALDLLFRDLGLPEIARGGAE